MGSRLEANSSAVRKRIENHKFEDEEGEEYQGSKFGGFTDYFRRKKIKLQNRDAELRSSASDSPSIFRGIVAHVNGYTQPSLNDLHKMIVEFGGGFMQYLDGKTTVTHIIAGSLTPKKKIEFRKYRIVKPAWVVDSIKAGKLLPWDSYRVVDEGFGQYVLGFENGSVVSQINSQHAGYREQMDTSWYTSQVKTVAEALDDRGLTELDPGIPFPSAQPSRLDTEKCRSSHEKHTPDTEAATPLDTSHSLDLSVQTIGETNDRPVIEHAADEFEDCFEDNDELTVQDAEFNEGLDKSVLDRETRDHVYDQKLTGSSVDANGLSPSKEAKLTAEEHNAQLLADPKIWKSTVVNPGFLKQYYEESRLHHLSTWKAELKSQLQAAMQEQSSSQKSRQRKPPGSRQYILHVDFDSFFAAVSLKKHPEYADQPVVVAHGGGSGSEIASCNYPARKFGVKNGMWMKSAQQLCPDLKVLPYDFKAYEEASKEFYEAVINTGGIVQSVSIDEALVDVSVACIEAGGHQGKGTSEDSIWREQARADEIANGLRDRVKEMTGCAVSIGIGGNILLAKVALRKAKPAGQYQIKPEQILEFIGGLAVQDLPGVAYSIGGKLEEIGVRLVKDIRELSKERLMTTLGPKTGEKIWDYSRGIDHTEVGEQAVRKSVSAEVNWGIRFVTQEQVEEFIQSLCDELHKRLINERVKGRQLTLKLMRRATDAPLDPPKHLGHGKCDTFNKSVILGVATNEKEIIGREAISISRGWGFPPGELRGIGAQMTKLEPLRSTLDPTLESSQRRLQFKKPLATSSTLRQAQDIDDIESPQKPGAAHIHPGVALTSSTSLDCEPLGLLNTLGTQFALPTQVDPSVLAEIPADIRSKLVPHSKSLPTAVPASTSRQKLPADPVDELPSLSQLDQETLNALPDDLREEILSSYNRPPHKPHCQAILPQSPRKNRTVKIATKKITTPTKKRSGLLSRGRLSSRMDSNSTLTQSNFIAANPRKAKDQPTTESEADEIDPEVLAALPEDIRREVLAQQRRDRLQKRGGINVVAKKKGSPPHAPPPVQRRLRLPERPPRPTFTAKKFSALPELRMAMSAWFEEFQDEKPDEDDVGALVAYLRRVVVDEGDMAKATGVAKWLIWIVSEGGEEAKKLWAKAVESVKAGVQSAVKERGLGRVEF